MARCMSTEPRHIYIIGNGLIKDFTIEGKIRDFVYNIWKISAVYFDKDLYNGQPTLDGLFSDE